MKDNFYSVSAQDVGDNSFNCTLHYNAAHPIFDGHFPGNPIVPGVCTMAVVKELLEDILDKKLLIAASKGVKFLGLIQPDMAPKMELNWKTDGEALAVSATLLGDLGPLFKMSADYRFR